MPNPHLARNTPERRTKRRLAVDQAAPPDTLIAAGSSKAKARPGSHPGRASRDSDGSPRDVEAVARLEPQAWSGGPESVSNNLAPRPLAVEDSAAGAGPRPGTGQGGHPPFKTALKEWSKHAPALAAWTRKNLVNRDDVFGHYLAVEARKDPRLTAFTDKSSLSPAVLAQHFSGASTGHLIGLHSTARADDGRCLSRWLGLDIDRHDETVDPESNQRAAIAWHERAQALGFHPLLTDSNGNGGFQLVLIFDAPTPTADVFRFARWLCRDWKTLGLAREPETFPKQAAIEADKFGNWLRLPGRHHTREHVSRVWDGSRWLDGSKAIRAIIETRGTPASLIPAEALETAQSGTTKARTTGKPKPLGSTVTDAEKAREALTYLGQLADDYAEWVKVGMSLAKLGDTGLALWDEWSRQSPKYQEGDCERKWRTFKPGGGRNLGSIFTLAEERGWPGQGRRATIAKDGRSGINGDSHAERSGSPPRFTVDGSPPDHPVVTEGPPPRDGRPNEAIDDPHRLARIFARLKARNPDGWTLRYWIGEWQRWDGSAYRSTPEREIRAEVIRVIKAEFNKINLAQLRTHADGDKPPPTVRPVTTKLVGNVMQALASLTLLGSRECTRQPAWIEVQGIYPAVEMLPTRNALVHLPSFVAGKRAVFPPTPRFFCPYALDFDFDADAPEPKQWLTFLEQLWKDDQQSIATLQEWAGLNLVPETRYQKIAAIIGPKRSGKGTIARVLTALVGAENVANPTLSSLGTNFGLAPLIGKLSGIIADARISGRADLAQVVERLLGISGEDGQTIDRKHLPAWTGTLTTRFTIISNEIPRLADTSGALPGRMILLRLTRSFYGEEDEKLMEKIRPELPGILLWAIEGWRRLRDRGHFVQPESGRPLAEELEDLASPHSMFVKECCKVGPHHEVAVGALFNRWKEWCAAKNREQVGDESAFGRNLRSVLPTIETKQVKQGGKAHRVFVGIDLEIDF